MKRIKPETSSHPLNENQFGYHVTASRHRESIESEGLRLSDIDNKHIWMFGDRHVATTMTAGNWGGSRGKNDLWEADVSGYERAPDPHPGWGDYRDETTFVVKKPVPPERLRRVTQE